MLQLPTELQLKIADYLGCDLYVLLLVCHDLRKLVLDNWTPEDVASNLLGVKPPFMVNPDPNYSFRVMLHSHVDEAVLFFTYDNNIRPFGYTIRIQASNPICIIFESNLEHVDGKSIMADLEIYSVKDWLNETNLLHYRSPVEYHEKTVISGNNDWIINKPKIEPKKCTYLHWYNLYFKHIDYREPIHIKSEFIDCLIKKFFVVCDIKNDKAFREFMRYLSQLFRVQRLYEILINLSETN